MNTRCTRCGRRLKVPSETGLGPVCQIAVLGRKPKRVRAMRIRAAHDSDTPDLFAEVAE